MKIALLPIDVNRGQKSCYLREGSDLYEHVMALRRNLDAAGFANYDDRCLHPHIDIASQPNDVRDITKRYSKLQQWSLRLPLRVKTEYLRNGDFYAYINIGEVGWKVLHLTVAFYKAADITPESVAEIRRVLAAV